MANQAAIVDLVARNSIITNVTAAASNKIISNENHQPWNKPALKSPWRSNAATIVSACHTMMPINPTRQADQRDSRKTAITATPFIE